MPDNHVGSVTVSNLNDGAHRYTYTCCQAVARDEAHSIKNGVYSTCGYVDRIRISIYVVIPGMGQVQAGTALFYNHNYGK